jgi:predicted Ser/Thr protein kinase
VLSPGDLLNGRYRLTQRIAAGGMGEVWRGDDLLLHREIAVKVLLPALMSDSEFITRFRSEARMMAALRHPGIVQVYDYGENAQVGAHRLDYLVMEFIDGTPLSQKIQQAGRLSAADTMAAVAQIADALQAAHDAGIIHRDVKPSNLLVRPAGAIVLVDFGVARSTGVTGITSTNVVLGSAHYMAPEQAEGRPVTAATDMYAVGAVAFCCLTGRPPYVGDNPLAVLAQLVHGQPPVLPPDVPPAVAAVVLRALAKDPARRFPSASALGAAALGAAAAVAHGHGPSGSFGPSGHGPSGPAGLHGHGAPRPGAAPTGGHPAGVAAAGRPGFAAGTASVGGPGTVGNSAASGSSGSFGNSGAVRGTGAVGSAGAVGGSGDFGGSGAVGRGVASGSGASPHGFAAGSASVGAGGYGSVGRPVTGGAAGHGLAVESTMGGATGQRAAATASGRRRNVTVALAAAAVVALLAGVGIILDSRPDGTDPVIEAQGSGVQGEQLQAGSGSGKPRGQVTGRPGTSKAAPKGGAGNSKPADEVPVTGPDATGQPAVTETNEPDDSGDPTTTEPATNPHDDPVALCGNGYQVINSKKLETSAGVLRGTVYLLYRTSGGKNCVVTIKADTLDEKTSMSATLEVQGSAPVADSGSFQYYAGPVTATAPKTCVRWGGGIGGMSYESDWSHCT